MNDNNFMNQNSNPNTYKATRNLNTAIENPEININSAIGVNIQDNEPQTIQNNDNVNNYFNQNIQNNGDINNYINTNINQNTQGSINTSQFNSNSFENNYNDNYINTYQETASNQHISNEEIIPQKESEIASYQPTMKQKKKKESIQMPSELKVTILIVLLLLVFIWVIPYIFDFIKNIELSLMR